MHVQVKELPASVRDMLRKLGYRCNDIKVERQSTISPIEYPGRGQRAFFAAMNLATGEFNVTKGSWGGANMFNPRNQVDLDDAEYAIPVNGLVAKGTEGHPRVYATLYVRPDMMGEWLGESEDMTRQEKDALYCHVAIKGGQYRRDELAMRKVSSATIDSLVDRGYLKRNKRGHVQVTTKGKNVDISGIR